MRMAEPVCDKTKRDQNGAPSKSSLEINQPVQQAFAFCYGPKKDRGTGFSVLATQEMKREPKNESGGRERGRKEMLADKPLDCLPVNAEPNWLGQSNNIDMC